MTKIFEWTRNQVFYVRRNGTICAARLTKAFFLLNGMCDRQFKVSIELANGEVIDTYLWRNDHNERLTEKRFYPSKEDALNATNHYCLTNVWEISHEIVNNAHLPVRMSQTHLMGYADGYFWDKINMRARKDTVSLHGVVDVLQRNCDISEICSIHNQTKWYLTKKACEQDNTIPIFEFNDNTDGEDFAEQKREEFHAYVAHHAPDFEDKINWEYFMNEKSMPWNLSEQIKVWMS